MQFEVNQLLSTLKNYNLDLGDLKASAQNEQLSVVLSSQIKESHPKFGATLADRLN